MTDSDKFGVSVLTVLKMCHFHLIPHSRNDSTAYGSLHGTRFYLLGMALQKRHDKIILASHWKNRQCLGSEAPAVFNDSTRARSKDHILTSRSRGHVITQGGCSVHPEPGTDVLLAESPLFCKLNFTSKSLRTQGVLSFTLKLLPASLSSDFGE